MQNLEIKASYDDQRKLRRILQNIGARMVRRGRQVDTYFSIPHGRLKLREHRDGGAELIFYRRGERGTKRWSNYFVYQSNNPKVLKSFLQQALPVRVVVDKQRELYRYRNAKIHIDRVKHLGNFMEIEVEVTNGKTQARELLETLLRLLKIPKSDFFKQSYSDLLK